MKYFARMLTMFMLLMILCACQPIVRPSEVYPPQSGEPAPDLFKPISPTDDRVADLDPIEDSTVARQRYVEIDNSVLTERITDPAADVGLPEPVTLPLFDDVTVEVIPESVEQVSSTTTNWVGRVQGSEQGNVVLVIRDGNITGNVIVDDTLYQIRPVGENLQSVIEVDQSGFPAEADPEQPELDSSEHDLSLAEADESTDATEDSPPIIDILVAYTPAAKIAHTLLSGVITDTIALAILDTNASFARHGLEVRVRLVYLTEVSYQEMGSMLADRKRDRERLRIDGDNHLDIVHDLREEYGADVVSLWIAAPGDICGIAYIMNPVSVAFDDFGFFVVKHNCATANYSFVHELGHILGARHDRFMPDPDSGPFTYNYGYVDIVNRRRTIMAYNDACDCSDEASPCPARNSRATENDPLCKRLPNWSDPSFMEDGVAFGIASTEAEAADNRLTISNTVATVASFRSLITITIPVTSPVAGQLEEDCLPYNPANLSIVDEGVNGWLLTDGVSRMVMLDNEIDARNALAMVQRHTAHCFIGRNNTRSNRNDYIVEYWLGDSGLATTIELEDCLPYNPADLTIIDEGAGGWLLTDNVSRMIILDNEADARNALTLAQQYTEQCFIGRNNTRPNRDNYIVAYWQKPSFFSVERLIDPIVVVVVPLATNSSIINSWAAGQEQSLNRPVEVVTELASGETADIFILPKNHESVLTGKIEKQGNIVTFYGGDFAVQAVNRDIFPQLATDLATNVLPDLRLGGLFVELPENTEITPEVTGGAADICSYPCGDGLCVFLC